MNFGAPVEKLSAKQRAKYWNFLPAKSETAARLRNRLPFQDFDENPAPYPLAEPLPLLDLQCRLIPCVDRQGHRPATVPGRIRLREDDHPFSQARNRAIRARFPYRSVPIDAIHVPPVRDTPQGDPDNAAGASADRR